MSSEVPGCSLSLQFHVGDVAAHAGECQPSPPATCAPNTLLHLAPRGCVVLPLQVQNYRCVSASYVVVVVVVIVVAVLVVLDAAAVAAVVVVGVALFGSCCSRASPVLVETVLASGCLLFVLALLSLFVVFGLVGSFMVLLLLLSECRGVVSAVVVVVTVVVVAVVCRLLLFAAAYVVLSCCCCGVVCCWLFAVLLS